MFGQESTPWPVGNNVVLHTSCVFMYHIIPDPPTEGIHPYLYQNPPNFFQGTATDLNYSRSCIRAVNKTTSCASSSLQLQSDCSFTHLVSGSPSAAPPQCPVPRYTSPLKAYLPNFFAAPNRTFNQLRIGSFRLPFLRLCDDSLPDSIIKKKLEQRTSA